jgi:hypothetical protein
MNDLRSPPLRFLAVLGLAVLTVAPTAGSAQPGPPGGAGGPGTGGGRSTQEQQAEVRLKRGEVQLEVDALEARNAELTAALVTLADNVANQQALLEEAQRVAVAAQEDVVEAEAAVADAQSRITELDSAREQLVVEAYMSPPSESALDTFDARSISDATVKQALLDLQAAEDADVLDQLTAAHEDVEVERQNKAVVAAEAERRQQEAAEALAAVEAAQAQQQAFADEAAASLERKLAESAALEAVDQELSRRIAEEQAALARRLAEEAAAREARERAAREAREARERAGGAGGGGGGGGAAPSAGPSRGGGAPAAGPGTITPVPGGLASVSCPGGKQITVAGSMADEVRRLLDAAAADGVPMCGWGWRNPQQQIALRRAHCGSSDYAIWHLPAGACSPPTARPGFSMHEVGLAIDFYCGAGESINTRRSRCYRWLAGNAGRFGLHNLPSEPWHWSTNGH